MNTQADFFSLRKDNAWFGVVIVAILLGLNIDVTALWDISISFTLLVHNILGITIAFLGWKILRLCPKTYTFSWLDLFVFGFVGYININCLFHQCNFTSDEVLTINLSGGIYAMLRLSVTSRTFIQTYFPYLAISIVCIQCGYVFFQWMGYLLNPNTLYRVGGSFGHPAMTAAILSLCVPFLLAEILRLASYKTVRHQLGRIGFGIAIAMIGIALVFLKSRSAWMSLGVSFVGFYGLHTLDTCRKYIQKLTSWQILAIGVGVVGCIAFLLLIKYDSTQGRFYIWKKSLELCVKYPIQGIGFGKFDVAYNTYQASHFANEQYEATEAYLANYVEMAFNEFIELATETGILGLILFLGIFVCFIRSFKRTSIMEYTLLTAMLAFVPLFMGWSLIKTLPFGILFFTFLGMKDAQPSSVSGFIAGLSTFPKYILGSMLILLSVLFARNRIHLGIANTQFRHASVAFREGKIEESITTYANAYTYLKGDHRFVCAYAKACIENGDYEKSIAILTEGLQHTYIPMLHLLMGDAYAGLNQIGKAEQAYMTAYYISPSKLYPRYLVAQLWYYNGQEKRAKEIAYMLVHSKHKTNSIDELMIIEEMKSYLK